MEETISYPVAGRRLDNSAGRIEDVSDEQRKEEQRDDDAAAQYEERMQEEYAKREGGA
jgi:hypothetical protein